MTGVTGQAADHPYISGKARMLVCCHVTAGSKSRVSASAWKQQSPCRVSECKSPQSASSSCSLMPARGLFFPKRHNGPDSPERNP